MSRFPKILGAILLALGLAGVLLTNLATSSLIVAIGVRAIGVINTIALITAGAGAATMAAGFIPNIKRLIDNSHSQKQLMGKKQEHRKTFDAYAKDSLNPQKTRERLAAIKENNSKLSSLVDRCLAQMNRMDKLQERYETLLEANDAIYLQDTVGVINDAETRLCRNIRNIINCCILVEDGSSELSPFDVKIINQALQQNETELQNVDTLIHYAVSYINNYQQNGVTDMSELKAWLEVMRKSTEEQPNETF
ncbi:MAG: hypothetical protein II118_07025 [Ruminococcus sp.]|jgi:hypothetical protein|nr:hypothetical protein [Ruminococcus sp.]MBQ1814607.1 hypothetical protein [Ruminococcus sp.]MBQ2570611.1 hypothetical protein [Ruminococcus sp.]MBQ5641026.1 hypothetical protein [Ruminococcus sp.]